MTVAHTPEALPGAGVPPPGGQQSPARRQARHHVERSLPLMPIEPCVFTDEVNPDFEEAVQLSVEAGATAMEIRGRLPGGSITTISNADVEMMQAILAKFNARVGSLGSPFGKCAMDNPEELAQHQRYFDRMLQLAEMFN